MSREALQLFCDELVRQDQQVRERLQACPDEETIVRLTLQLGEENGYDFTREDVMEVIAEARQQQEITYPLEDIFAVARY